MNIHEIEAVCELTSYGSFKEAAKHLLCSPSVVTKYVANVENELGIKLFVRSNRSSALALTPDGEEVMDSLRHVRDDYRYTLEICERLKTKNHKVLPIGMQPRFGTKFESQSIARFIQEHPEVEVRVYRATVGELTADLRSGKIDALFAVLYKDVDPEEYFRSEQSQLELSIERIASEDNMYCGIADYYLPGRDEVKLRELRDFTFALPFPLSGDTQEIQAMASWNEQAEKSGFKLKAINFSALDEPIFQLAIAQQIAICSTNIPPEHVGIKFVHISDWGGGVKLYLIHRKDNHSTPLIDLKNTAGLGM